MPGLRLVRRHGRGRLAVVAATVGSVVAVDPCVGRVAGGVIAVVAGALVAGAEEAFAVARTAEYKAEIVATSLSSCSTSPRSLPAPES